MELGWIDGFGAALIVLGSFGSFLLHRTPSLGPRLVSHIVMFFGVGCLYWGQFSLSLVAAIVLTGVISAIIISAFNFLGSFQFRIGLSRSVLILRLFIGVVIGSAAWFVLPYLGNWLPILRSTLLTSLWIFLFGMMTFALGNQLADWFFGLLCMTQGFLMIYVSLENSVTLLGALLFFQLIIAFLGSYCMTLGNDLQDETKPGPEPEETIE